jgi:RNA polymerase sigma factor (sigma-70 family)
MTTEENDFQLTQSIVNRRRRPGPWKSISVALITSIHFSAQSFECPIFTPIINPYRPSFARQSTVVDSEMLILENVKCRTSRKDLDKMFMLSATLEPDGLRMEDHSYTESIDSAKTFRDDKYSQSDLEDDDDNNNSNQSGEDVCLTSTSKLIPVSSTSKRKSTTKSKMNRNLSSTMPGMDRYRVSSPSKRLNEERSKRQSVDTEALRRNRRKVFGENLYKMSASVPDSMVQFADQIHREDRITHKEELELGSKTQEAIRIQNLYDSLVKKLSREPSDDEWCAAAGKINMEAIRQTIDEGMDAKNKLVTSNLRMVQSVVNTYIRNGLSAQYNAGDMMQEGIVALIRAAEKFEPDRGWKFSTYAMYWVRASVKRSQISQSRVITVPQRLYENHKRLQRIEKEMFISTGRKPTYKELGEVVGMSEMQVDRCFTAMKQQCFSLDQQITNSRKPMSIETSRDTMIDIIESKAIATEEDDATRSQIREEIIASLRRHLPDDEVKVLTIRFGLQESDALPARNFHGNPPLVTIAELSRMVGMKPDKIRRMINKSLQHLKTVGFDEYIAFEREIQ